MQDFEIGGIKGNLIFSYLFLFFHDQFAGTRIIKNQKRIAKRCKNKDYFFTAAMLDRNIIIKTGIEGLNPDAENVINDQDTAEKDWIEKHPIKKELSEEKKEELRERAKKLTEFNRQALNI